MLALAIYMILAVLFYMIAGQQLRVRADSTDSVSPSVSVGEILSDMRLEQQFTVQSDRFTSFSVLCGTFGRQNSGTLLLELYEQAGPDEKTLIEAFSVDLSGLQDNSWYTVQLTRPLENAAGKTMLLEVSAEDSALGNAVTLYYGDSVSTGRVEITSEGWTPLLQNGQPLEGTLCLRTTGETDLWFGRYYWYFAAAAGLLLGPLFLAAMPTERKRENLSGSQADQRVQQISFFDSAAGQPGF